MTTRHSPPRVLKAQADKVAATLKAAERGAKIDARYAAKIAEARGRASFKFAIVMDDKLLTMEISWARIRDITEAELSEWIVKQMSEARDDG